MRIAVASTNGKEVDLHFGKTTKFMVFEVFEKQDGELVPIGERECARLSVEDKNHPFDKERFEAVYSAIRDCERVYVTRIGERPEKELKDRGIEAVIYSGPISGIRL